jgi:4-amino-4-deoxy-L-arabinose transferase-like glycosyltransferase
LFYLPVIFSDSFPISAFLFMAAVIWPRERARVQTVLWCWIVAIVAFFSLSAGKQDLYIFPIVAAVAALGGVAIIRGACEPEWRQWLRGTLLLTGALLAAAAVAVLWLFEAGGHVYALEGALTIGICGLIGGALVCAFAIARRCVAGVLALLLSLIAIDYAFVAGVLPDFERYKPVPKLAAILHDRAGPDDIVANYQVALPSMVYYLQRHVEEYFDEEPFVRALLSQRRMYAVLSEEDYNALSPVLGSRACVLDRRPTFDVKLRNVLARQPLPELLLITNRCK